MTTRQLRTTSVFTKFQAAFALGLLLASFWAYAEAPAPAHAEAAAHEAGGDETTQLRAIVKTIVDGNAAFVKSHTPEYFKPFADKQHPRATVVTCSDSRVHTHALTKAPDGDLFMVRNIGNQLGTAEGSVEYGVHHLHTPLLIIVGHVACGAIKAAMSDFSKESIPIRNELSSIDLPPRNAANDETQEWLRGVDANVNNQVELALQKFPEEVKSGKLTVIGAIYDFQNAMHQGYGKLVITNINGNHDTANVLVGIGRLTSGPMGEEKKAAPAHRAKPAAAPIKHGEPQKAAEPAKHGEPQKAAEPAKHGEPQKPTERAEPAHEWGK